MVKIACTQAWFARGQQNKSKASRGPGELAERAWHRIRECDFFCDAQRSRTAVGTTADSWMSKSHYMEPQTEFLPMPVGGRLLYWMMRLPCAKKLGPQSSERRALDDPRALLWSQLNLI
jgi:hypothetical protein